MKKAIIAIIVIIVIAAAYWAVSPLWRMEYVSEGLPQPQSAASSSLPIVLKSGTFTGFDKLHNGTGTAKLIQVDGKTYVRFEDDFNVTNGPDLYVGFGKDGEYIKGSELAPLKGNVGSQNYELPAGMNPTEIQEVWVWCKAFSTPFVRATLQ